MKMEKANAISRNQRFTNIAKLCQAFEVLIVLTFISWSSTHLPSAVKFSGEYFFSLSTYLLNPHVVFIIGNVLVIALYVLSRHTDAKNDDFAEKSCANHVHAILDPAQPPVTECEAAATVIEQAAKQIEQFQRTESEKLKREISVKPRRELRRSVTVNDQRRAITEFDTVDRLSNEEFRLAVEAFISKQQSFLKAQSMPENE